MFTFITIIKPTILPSIRVSRDGLLFCEPMPIRLIWLGYNCNDVTQKRPDRNFQILSECIPPMVLRWNRHKSLMGIFDPILNCVQPRCDVLQL